LLKQIVAVIILQTGAVTAESLLKGMKYIMSFLSEKGRMMRLLRKQIADPTQTKTFDDFMLIAEKIDSLKGDDVWRRDPNCELYEAERLGARIDECKHLIRRGDIFDTMFTLRGGIAR